MCPLPYDAMRRDSKDPRQLRYRLVLHAAEHGLKPTARAFHTTPQTVRKWVRRWGEHGWAGLVEQSRAPRNPVRRITTLSAMAVRAVRPTLSVTPGRKPTSSSQSKAGVGCFPNDDS